MYIYDDLLRLKELLDEATHKLLQLKNIFNNSTDLVSNIFKNRQNTPNTPQSSDDE